MEEIRQGLFALQDEKYRQFHSKLMPETDPECIIGVRMPALRQYAKELAGRGGIRKDGKPEDETIRNFLAELPHHYYEENNLHGALLTFLYRDLEEFLKNLEIFLPYIDNWATCDMISPKIFRRDLPRVHGKIREWLKSDHTYTVRFGLVTLLEFFLDDGVFEPEMLDLAAGVLSEEYYVKMAVAWYFSIALVKQYEATIPYFTSDSPVLDPWIHNKALQKAVESRRISDETKAYLKTLKVKIPRERER